MPKELTIGFIGNFNVSWTTECDRAWSFRKLGHKVVPLQENKTTAGQLRRLKSQVDLLIYSHTHDPSWEIKGLKEVFAEYKDAGVPTASAHLDRWLWLEREKDMGHEATWFTEYIFMADGSPEAAKKYDDMGLNWHWLKPGVVERDCYMAKPDREKFPHDVVFTGSRGYHQEWSWRPRMVDWLKETYGDRFGMYGNDGIMVARGKDLNTLYASSKIVVGDSCFGGRPHYLSDRYYEVPGRGGFLIHPNVGDSETMENRGVIPYAEQNFDALKSCIDYYLKNPLERENLRSIGHGWVKGNATYTHRAKEMLSVMGLA